MADRTTIALVNAAASEFGQGHHSSASYLLLLAIVARLAQDVEVAPAIKAASEAAGYPIP